MIRVVLYRRQDNAASISFDNILPIHVLPAVVITFNQRVRPNDAHNALDVCLIKDDHIVYDLERRKKPCSVCGVVDRPIGARQR
jgi:hypothetical protein